MAKLRPGDFFFLVSLYMSNNKHVRTNLQGNSKRTHCNLVLRVYRSYCQSTAGREEDADFPWKKRMAQMWKIMQGDTLKRAQNGVEKAVKSADPYEWEQLRATFFAAHRCSDPRVTQSLHICMTSFFAAHRASQSYMDKILHYSEPITEGVDSELPPRIRYHPTYAQKATRVQSSGSMKQVQSSFISEFNNGPNSPALFAEAHSRVCAASHRPVGPYCPHASVKEPQKNGELGEVGQYKGGCYLKLVKRGSSWKEGVLFTGTALSRSAVLNAFKVLKQHHEAVDPVQYLATWQGCQHKKHTMHSMRATYPYILRKCSVPEHWINMGGNWANNIGAGVEYGHVNGIAPDEIMVKICRALGGYRRHFDDMVLESTALIQTNRQMQQQQTYLIAQLQRATAAGSPTAAAITAGCAPPLQLPTSPPLGLPTAPSAPAPAAAPTQLCIKGRRGPDPLTSPASWVRLDAEEATRLAQHPPDATANPAPSAAPCATAKPDLAPLVLALMAEVRATRAEVQANAGELTSIRRRVDGAACITELREMRSAIETNVAELKHLRWRVDDSAAELGDCRSLLEHASIEAPPPAVDLAPVLAGLRSNATELTSVRTQLGDTAAQLAAALAQQQQTPPLLAPLLAGLRANAHQLASIRGQVDVNAAEVAAVRAQPAYTPARPVDLAPVLAGLRCVRVQLNEHAAVLSLTKNAAESAAALVARANAHVETGLAQADSDLHVQQTQLTQAKTEIADLRVHLAASQAKHPRPLHTPAPFRVDLKAPTHTAARSPLSQQPASTDTTTPLQRRLCSVLKGHAEVTYPESPTWAAAAAVAVSRCHPDQETTDLTQTPEHAPDAARGGYYAGFDVGDVPFTEEPTPLGGYLALLKSQEQDPAFQAQ